MSETSGQPTTETAPVATAEAAPAAAPAAPAAAAPAADAAPATQPTSTEAPNTAAPQGAPEKYEFKPVDGLSLSDAVLAKFGETAKALNMPQDAAQKILADVGPAIAAQQAEMFKATVEGWKQQAASDKEIGGDKLAENLALAKRAIDAYFTPEFVQLLDSTGLGNHPDLIRGLMKVGRTVSPDRFVQSGNGSANNGKSHAEILYGN